MSKKTTGDVMRDVADSLENLKNVVIITARNEILKMMARLRMLAIREDARNIEKVGTCDACGSRLVWRGRNPSTLRCPLECDSSDV